VNASDPQTLRAAADRILELHERGRLEEARNACRELERDAGDVVHRVVDPVVRESVFTARFERGVIATELGDLPGAAAGYLAAAGLPVDPDDPDQTHELAMALLNAGICWSALGDDVAAVATYDDLVARVGHATDAVTVEQVVRARVNRAVALLQLERLQDACDATGRLLADLDPDDPVAAEQRGMALRVRAAALRGLDRPEDAAVTLADAQDLAAVPAGAVRTQAVAAQGERAQLLVDLGRPEEAIALLDDAVDRYAADADTAEVVADLARAEADLLEATGQSERAAEVRARVTV
jgi:tetratricopeptide (TPR) repeat protein